jgi:hypothetical protein
VVSVTGPSGRILDFLDRSRYFSLICTHEAEWTPFKTHYFSENVVAPGIEPGPLGQWTTEADYFLLHNIYKFSSYLTGSTIHLRFVARNSDR